jgi:hypothetical protein
MHAGRLDEALAKLIDGIERFSDDPQLVTMIGDCLRRMGRDADADRWVDSTLKTADSAEPASRPSDYELMMMFQSLGENCEFGLAQRHFQAEPLGLLRWTAISVHNLTRALNENFANVGLRAETRLVEVGTEYMTAHSNYGMGSHTFIQVDKDNEEAIFKAQLVRLAFLRRKLIEDLESGEQTFIYTSENGATDDEIDALHKAVVRYGARYFLFVRKSSDTNPPGTVTYVGDGLMLGYMDRLGPDRLAHGDVWNTSHDCWIAVLDKANRLRKHDECIRALVRSTRPSS